MRMADALRNSGLNVIWEDGICFKIEYNEKTFWVAKNDGYTDWTPRFSISVDGKTLATRCNYRTIVRKIKTFK